MRGNVYKISSTIQLVLYLSSSDVKHYKTVKDCFHLKVQHSSLCMWRNRSFYSCLLLSTIKILFYIQQIFCNGLFIPLMMQFSQRQQLVAGIQLIWYWSRFSVIVHCWIIYFWFCNSNIMIGGSLELLHIQGSYSNSN